MRFLRTLLVREWVIRKLGVLVLLLLVPLNLVLVFESLFVREKHVVGSWMTREGRVSVDLHGWI